MDFNCTNIKKNMPHPWRNDFKTIDKNEILEKISAILKIMARLGPFYPFEIRTFVDILPKNS